MQYFTESIIEITLHPGECITCESPVHFSTSGQTPGYHQHQVNTRPELYTKDKAYSTAYPRTSGFLPLHYIFPVPRYYEHVEGAVM